MDDMFGGDVTTSPAALGSEREADTHGMVAAGALGTAAGDTTLGTIVLPAGGPWNIFGLWCQVVNATNTAAQAIAGYMRLESAVGDLDPNPAPSKFPFPAHGSYLGATANVQISPLVMYPVRYLAPGKASIALIVHQNNTNTVAPQAVCGIIFGKTIPKSRPFVFCEQVRAAVTSAADTSVGTITLAEKATVITGICAVMVQDGVLTTAEELIGRWRMASDDIKMPPSDYPFSAVFGAGLGGLIDRESAVVPQFIPVNIPVVGGARIDTFIDLNTAVTNGAEVNIYIAYE